MPDLSLTRILSSAVILEEAQQQKSSVISALSTLHVHVISVSWGLLERVAQNKANTLSPWGSAGQIQWLEKKNNINFPFQYMLSECFPSAVTICTHESARLGVILNFLPLMLSERSKMLCYSAAPLVHCNKTVNATYQDQNMLTCPEIP